MAQTKRVEAAKTVMRVILTSAAILSKCETADPGNRKTFEGLYIELVWDRMFDRALDVLELYDVGGVRAKAAEETAKLAASDPARFLEQCRQALRDSKTHSGMFAPLIERYPAETRMIDDLD